MITSVFILGGVTLAYLIPDRIIGYMMSIPGFTVILIWLAIVAAQIRLRKGYKANPTFQLKWFPITNIIAIVSLLFIFISFLFNKDNIIGSTVCVATVLLLILISFFRKSGNVR
jgi:AAT family amino acid transporter